MILYFILLDKQTKRIIEFCKLFVFELEKLIVFEKKYLNYNTIYKNMHIAVY